MDAVKVIVALASLLAPASAGSSSCDIGQYWVNIPGGLSWVSSGNAGVWGVNSLGNIFYRLASYTGLSYYSYDGRNYGFSHTDGTGWIQVAGGLNQIDVGKDSVWGTIGGSVYYRNGISSVNPIGTGWTNVPGLAAAQVSVSDVDGKVWAVASGSGYVYRRVGISDELPGGSSWEFVPGISARFVDIGGAGVWATTLNGQVYYRTGSRHDCQGSGWQVVSGTIYQIASGGDNVWGVAPDKSIWFKLNITSASPTGNEWIQVPGGLSQISVATSDNSVWGVNSAGSIYTRH